MKAWIAQLDLAMFVHAPISPELVAKASGYFREVLKGKQNL
jgi:hypothetical protein